MVKIDLEKLICSLAKRKYFSEEKLQDALKEQGLEYKDGKIVEIQKLKFKVGDWIVNNTSKDVFLIKSINSGYCTLEDIKGNIISPCLPPCENESHLWTIEDAKDGDVLVDVYGNIGIFEKHDGFDWTSYCSLGVRGGFQSFKVEHENGNTCPATNAQRHTLFAKMKEAGYTFDFDKKELKPIDNRFDYEHANIQQKDYAHKEDVKPFDKYKGLTDFERTLTDICIGWIGEEHGWKQYIKDNADVLLKIAIEKFNKDFDLVDDKELFFGDFRKTDSENKGKALFANRQLYNRAILKILSDYIEKYPDTRFGQMLCNLNIKPHFDQESRETYCSLNETINKQNHE